jgi:DNA-directed RNA polymerase sigma subunit (sigma70/sigma32)
MLARSAPRRARILELRREGKSLSEVAAEVGITRQRVHAILRACAPELAGRQQHTPAA